MLRVDEDYVSVVGTKGDFCSPSSENRNVEIYDAATAKLLVCKVYEDVTTVQYYTYWMPITDLTGISTVKKVDEMNDKNPDTVYINGSGTPFAVKYNTLVGVKTSRWFDIEFKTVYAYRVNAEGEIEKFSFEVPMLFVQSNRLDDFLGELYNLNKAAFSSAPTLKTDSTDIAYADFGFDTLIPAYNAVKDAVTRDAIAEYLGISKEEET